MKGDGIRTTITVTGSGGTATAKPTQTVTIEAMDYSYGGLAGMTFTKGETVEFRLHNEAPEEKHELEIFGPDGDALGEVGPTRPGATGHVVLTLDRGGHLPRRLRHRRPRRQGMKGTFTVA